MKSIEKGKENIIIETKSGKVTGYVTDNGITCFKGIPFAESPINGLRFNPPVQKLPWAGILECKEFGPVAPQPYVQTENNATEPIQQNEADCLTLNIWTPAIDAKKRAVMVWIHGGGFEFGSNRVQGKLIAKHGNIVIVSLNYRLGALGFLYVPGKTANVGLLDQVLGLKWVKENISVFGGDPENVCIFGASAGGESVSALLGMPSAKGLFSRAIIQNNVCDSYNLNPDNGETFTKKIFKHVGIEYSDLDSLREVPAEKLVKAFSIVQKNLTDLPLITGFYPPYVDGKVLPKDPFEMIEEGFAKDIEILGGTTENEYKFWNLIDPNSEGITKEQLENNISLFLQYLNQDDDKIHEFIKLYKNIKYDDLSTIERNAMDNFYSDAMFRIPVMRFLENQSKFQPNVYLYLFSWKSMFKDGKYGAYHAMENTFIWGTLSETDGQFLVKKSDETMQLSEIMMDCWINFAKNGNPNHSKSPEWLKFNTTTRSTMVFNKNTRIENDPNPNTRKIWDGII